MKKKNLNIIIIFFLLARLSVCAQNSTSSPYSRYGIGDIANKSFGQSKAMGGISLGIRTPYHLNVTNPASYSSLDSLSFIFEFGFTSKTTLLQTEGINQSIIKQTNNDINLSYISVGYPITKWWFGSFGLIPFSNVGYNIKNEEIIDSIGNVETYYNGSGGINQFYIGNSIKFHKNLSAGFNASYLFGSLNQTKSVHFPDDDNAFNSFIENKIIIGDIYFNFGLQYNNNFNDKYKYTIGIIFDNQSKIQAYNSTLKTNYIYSDQKYTTDTLENTEHEKDYILLPYNFGIGFSITKDDKITFGADYLLQDWSNSTFFGENHDLANSNTFAFGFEYIPEHDAKKKYLRRIYYRLGGHYSNTYLNIPLKDEQNKLTGNFEQLKDFGISFGIGLPLRRSKTSFNIVYELGQRGTLKYNLIKETYNIISFNLTLYDIWFIKRKFD